MPYRYVRDQSMIHGSYGINGWLLTFLACYDGHVQPVRLDNLWKFSWHKLWIPPSKRSD